MSYYMRYLVTDERSISVDHLRDGLTAADPRDRIEESGDLYLGDQLLGEVEVNTSGDGLFDEERDELMEELADEEAPARDRIAATLENARAILAVRVSWQGRGSDETLNMLEPLWDWLFENREGLLQADGEGRYDATGPILAIE